MKNLMILLVFILTIISCSPKYTASFQNYDRPHSATNQIINSEKGIVSTKPETQSLTLTDEVSDENLLASISSQPTDFEISQPKVKSVDLESVSKEERKTLIKQIKSEVKSSKQEPKSDKPGEESRNTYAILGFIFSVSGLALGILFPPLIALLIPGMIFSILGLKSKKKGWAIAGLIISSVAILLGALVILAYALADWG